MKTTIIDLPLEGLKLIEIDYFMDKRGFFIEPWNKKTFKDIGLDVEFVQEGHSGSGKNVLRGLHSQDARHPMGKLIRCVVGEIWDIAVDIRHESITFGEYYATVLSAKDKIQLYIPPGFAHGFCTLTDYSEIQYKQTGYYAPDNEFGIMWNDPDLNINWPIKNPQLSEKDKQGISFAEYKKSPKF
jgi:dTDP-4-dehydrorhamnose 3,5-epimerase